MFEYLPPDPPAAVILSDAVRTDEAVLRQLKTVEWPRVYRERDLAGLEALLHPDYQVFDGDTVGTKADQIAWVRENAWDNDGFTYTIKVLRVFGDAAIVNGEGVIRLDRGPTPHQVRYSSSNMFVRTEGRWQAISSHVGPSKEEPLTPQP